MMDGGIGLKRLQHLVLWISDVERSVRFYVDVLGFEVKTRYPRAAFLRCSAPGASAGSRPFGGSTMSDVWRMGAPRSSQ